jgi:hypothetical protein
MSGKNLSDYWKDVDAQFTAGVSGKRKRLPSSKVVDQQSNEEDVNVMPSLPQAEKPPSKQKKKKPAKNTPAPPSDKCPTALPPTSTPEDPFADKAKASTEPSSYDSTPPVTEAEAPPDLEPLEFELAVEEAEAPAPLEDADLPPTDPSKAVSKAAFLALPRTTDGWCISVDTENGLWCKCRCPYGRVESRKGRPFTLVPVLQPF